MSEIATWTPITAAALLNRSPAVAMVVAATAMATYPPPDRVAPAIARRSSDVW